MKKGLKFFLIFVLVMIIGLYALEKSSITVTDQNGQKTISTVDSTQNTDLNTFLVLYHSGVFDKVEVVDNTTIQGYQKIPQSGQSNMLEKNGYKTMSYTVFSTEKPKDTTINELGLTLTGTTSIQIINNEQSARSKLLFDTILPAVFFVGLFMILLRFFGPKNGGLPFGMNIGKLNNKNNNNTSTKFKDVAGMEEAKQELQEIVDFLKNPEKYLKIGARIPKGVLLYGPPGCGKTLLARAVAGEAGVPFYASSGSEFMEMLVGMGAAKVRELFGKAKQGAPSIIFIDELDTIGKKRGSGYTGGHQEQEQTLNQILTEMDGFEQGNKVIVIAATNRPDVLDPALLRPGRFDRKVMVGRPTVEERLEIIKLHSATRKLDGNIDLEIYARRTSGFVGADLENMINEAALKAAKDNRILISQRDFEYALEKVIMGPEKKIKTLKEKERKIVAYHELGHAVTAYNLPNVDPVEKISIVSRGMALGVTWMMPQEDSYLSSKSKFLEELISLLGGRAAEETFFGKDEITTGASNDFEKATKIATNMITKYGMEPELGTITYDRENNEYSAFKPFSEKTAEKIDSKIKEIMDKAYEKSVSLIQDNKDLIHKLADLLIEKEYLSKEEFEELMKNPENIDSRIEEIKNIHKALIEEEKKVENKNTEKKKNTKAKNT